MSARAMRWLLIVIFAFAWEIVPRVTGVLTVLIPPLSTTLRAGIEDAHIFLPNFIATLEEVAAAILLACMFGVPIGALLGANKFLSRTLLPLLSSLYAVPFVILYPLFTVWLGIGSSSKIAFGAFYGLFPTLLATASGVATIPRQFRILAYSMRVDPFQEVVRVLVPATIPTVLNGLRLGGALAIVGVIVAEMLTSTAGIGYLISYYRTLLDTPHVFFAIILVIALVIAFDFVMRQLERSVSHWMPEKGKAQEEVALAVH
jgi:NitT/TauT family transport system permease protein